MKKVLKKIIPKSIWKKMVSSIERKSEKKYLDALKNKILNYYKDGNFDEQTNQVIQFLQSNPISVFPYEYTKKYSNDLIEVKTDPKNGLKYVLHDNKKLFFKRSISENGVKGLYRGLQIDQDKNSPHLYLTDSFNLNSNDVIADIGSAEGNFALSNIEKVKKVYLFESDLEWIEALNATFEPWKDKVEIINKYITNYDSDTTLNIDTFYKKNQDITFFKVDIEGEEQNFLNSCEPLFKSDIKLKIAICTYHKQNDEQSFTSQLKNWGFKVEPSNGFMIFIYDKLLDKPYLRRGLLRAEK